MASVKVFCMQCGKKFSTPKFRLRWGGSSVCSKKCAITFNDRIKWSSEESPDTEEQSSS